MEHYRCMLNFLYRRNFKIKVQKSGDLQPLGRLQMRLRGNSQRRKIYRKIGASIWPSYVNILWFIFIKIYVEAINIHGTRVRKLGMVLFAIDILFLLKNKIFRTIDLNFLHQESLIPIWRLFIIYFVVGNLI